MWQLFGLTNLGLFGPKFKISIILHFVPNCARPIFYYASLQVLLLICLKFFLDDLIDFVTSSRSIRTPDGINHRCWGSSGDPRLNSCHFTELQTLVLVCIQYHVLVHYTDWKTLLVKIQLPLDLVLLSLLINLLRCITYYSFSFF